MNWIFQPLSTYALMAVGLVLTLYLFISLKVENARLRHRLEQQLQQSQEHVGELRTALGSLEHTVQEREQHDKERDLQESQMAGARTLPGLSINLTKRTQALRLHRRGESPEQICATLQMPRSEVDLLLKVQKALADSTT